MELFNGILKLLILPFIVMNYASCRVYYIIPSSNCPCIEDSCLTLSQMIDNVDSNTTLIIMEGNHTLNKRIAVSNTEYFSMFAASNATTITISCSAAGYFTLSNVLSVYISGLTFTGCNNNKVAFVSHLMIKNTKCLGQGRNGTFMIIDNSSVELTKTFISKTAGKLENGGRYLSYLQTVSSIDYKQYGSITLGGAILLTHSNLSINYCRFSGNRANIGGAIFSDFESNINISNSEFASNQATGCNDVLCFGLGGALFVGGNSTVVVHNCTFYNNTSDGDGGVAGVFYANLYISKSYAYGNVAANNGGVVATFESSYLYMNTTKIDCNIAQCNGGAIANTKSTTTHITHCNFSENSARQAMKCNGVAGNGGVVYAEINSSITVEAVMFVKNSAKSKGGVLHIQKESNLAIKNSTVLESIAMFGGVLFATDSTNISVSSGSILERNTANSDGGIAFLDKLSNIVINDSMLSVNEAQLSGGVICTQEKSRIMISSSTFTSNKAKTFGGVIRMRHNSIVLVNDSKFNNNYAGNNGGVFDGFYATNIKMYRSKFNNNSARLKGGVLIMVREYYDSENSSDSGEMGINEVINCTFTNNSAPNGGVFALQRKVSMSIQNSIFKNNNAMSDGGTLYILMKCTITIYSSTFNGNMAINNGVIFATYKSAIIIYGSQFSNNSAGFNGGAVYVLDNCTTTIKDSKFISNSASGSGGTIYGRKSSHITINNGTFNQSIALNSGGVVDVQGNSTVMMNNSNFNRNAADYGGVVRVYGNSSASIVQCNIQENQASTSGGVMAAYKSSVLVVKDSLFIQNTAIIGGVAVVFQTTLPDYLVSTATHFGYTLGTSSLIIDASVFRNNSADHGGVLYVQEGNVTVAASIFYWNTARLNGGAVRATNNSTVTLIMNKISHSTANKHGGVMYLTGGSHAHTKCCIFISNNALMKGGVFYLQISDAYVINSTFKSSIGGGAGGAIYSYNSSLQIEYSSFSESRVSHGSNGGAVHIEWYTYLLIQSSNFTNNTANHYGGALSLDKYSKSIINDSIFQHNVGKIGGALAVFSDCYVYFSSNKQKALMYNSSSTQNLILNNTANISGGGIYIHDTSLHFRAETRIYHNRAGELGGGIHAINSSITLMSKVQFSNNRATKGGGISLTTTYLYNDDNFKSTVSFAFNQACFGGAFYVDDCSGNNKTLLQGCFFQHVTNNLIISLNNNSANSAGDDLYGGLLDRCSMDRNKNHTVDGISRWKVISNLTGLSTVSSQPVKVCHCRNLEPNCLTQDNSYSIQVKHGDKFRIPVVVVDQVQQPVKGIISSMLNESDVRLPHSQAIKSIDAACYDLEYNVSFPVAEKAYELIIGIGNASCIDTAFSKIKILVNVINCSCAPGFMPAGIKTECYCVCDKHHQIFSKYIQDCNYETLTVIRQGIFWITYVTDSKNNGYLFFPYCPLEYCQPPGVSIPVNLSQPNGSDAQCADNRVGLLCGSCPHNYSLSLGSAKCIVCPDNWHGLLVVIILAAFFAGIALVFLLLVFNLTVAVGTLNSIIFYANIVYANKSIYFGHSHFMLIQMITSWLNLDIGFDTCFFDGMDTYIKTWLQLAFPVYIIALVIVIILISSCSSKFSQMIGRKDPVATLATLILLSYTKLLQIVLAASSYVQVKYPNGTTTIRWVRDANIHFGTGKSIALICISLTILFPGLLYTILVLFWQCLVKCPRSRLFGCTRNHKLYSFINTYHIPHTAKHRYWPGLLLLIRVTVYLIASFSASSDQPITLLSTAVIMCCLLLYKTHLGTRVYRNWLLNAMESFVLFNITVFAVLTMFTFNSVTGSKESLQRVVANLSIGSILLLILFVIVYHVYRYGSAKIYTLVGRTSLCRRLRMFDQNRHPWKQLDNPLLDVVDDPRYEPDIDSEFMPSSQLIATSSIVSMSDVQRTSIAMSTLDQSTVESLNVFQDQGSRLTNKPTNRRSFEVSNTKPESKLFSSTSKTLSSIKQPLLEENQ